MPAFDDVAAVGVAHSVVWLVERQECDRCDATTEHVQSRVLYFDCEGYGIELASTWLCTRCRVPR